MTNNWVDIDYTSLVYVQGANPAENHPACMGHVNAARFGSKTVPGYPAKSGAQMIVVDPRQTRTARQIDPSKGDRFIRIRPGTDIAFINAVLNQIFTRMYEAIANPADLDYATAVNFFAWHNSTTASNSFSGGRSLIDDGGTARTLTVAELAGASYSYDGGVTYAPTTALTTGWPKYCDSRAKVNGSTSAANDYKRVTMRTASGWVYSNMIEFAATVDDSETVMQRLRAHVAKYPASVAADICGCLATDIEFVADRFIKHSRHASADFGAATADATLAGYRATTILYAMGITQHTCGSQNIRDYGIIQTLMGNMGRQGGGINALRGIHNVQGSTDMATLFDGIPGYSGNPGVGVTYPAYSNGLFGNRMVGTGAKNPYTPGDLGLQQRGFYNMTREWFGNRDVSAQADFDALWAMWPKGNGYQHTEAIRRMEKGEITACVVWGQNPIITEPNQEVVRAAFENLDLLVVTDLFATETAQTSRKAGAPTYLFPACSHVEEAGSVTNSGRWIQWRERATAPKGNSKTDLELLLRFAKALNTAGAFSHIKNSWATMSAVPSLYAGGAGADPFTVLYAKHGWDGTGDFEAVSGLDAEGATLVGSEYVAEQIFKEIASPLNAATGPAGTLWIYSGNGNASAYCSTDTTNVSPTLAVALPAGSDWTWGKANRAKVRKGGPEFASRSGSYPRYGWAWLLNRRVFYNNSEVLDDVGDVFVAPGYLSRLFTINTNTLADWSALYRSYNTLKDQPSAGVGVVHVHPGRFPAHTEPIESPRADLTAAYGRNTSVGNSLYVDAAMASANTWVETPVGVFGDSIADPTKFDLVLTTIRCVEHFQGGPITRNNPWNHEMEPEPWVEINSADALKFGIKDGDWVDVVTARGNSVASQTANTRDAGTPGSDTYGFAKGFKARVGVGTLANQRVAPGVVAIPWHWGERGLSKGSRANDLCIDAWDANTMIPESKACLCRIRKVGA